MKKHLGKIIISVAIIAIAFYMFVIKPGSTVAAWLDSAWGYRKQITITGTTAGAQTNYQMKLTVHRTTGSDSGADVYVSTECDSTYKDIRFTNSDGTTLLDYWIESSDSNTATIWIEFDSIPASPSTATFYMYYGNASASSGSNGTNTFVFFDDFDDSSLDVTKWSTHAHGSGTIVESGTTVKLDIPTSLNQAAEIKSVSAFQNNTHARMRIRQEANTPYYTYPTWGYLDNFAWWPEYTFTDYFFITPGAAVMYSQTMKDGSAGGPVNIDAYLAQDGTTWNITDFKYLNQNCVLNIDGTDRATHTTAGIVPTTDAMNILLAAITHTSSTPDNAIWLEADWVFVGKYTSPEPTWTSWGGEEPAPTPTPTPTSTPTPTPTPKFSFTMSNLQKGLVGHWDFNGNAKDSTPYSNNGAVTGATLTTDRKSQANKAYSFNGTSNHILAGNVGSSIKTISFWMQADDTTSRKIINIDGTDQIELDGSSNVVATSFPGATVYVDGSVGSAILDTNWHLVTITDSTGVSASTFDIGAVSTSYFSGKIDDVRIYNRVLSQAEITTLYQEYDPGVQVSDLQKGLVGNWKMDNNAKDSTPYSNNGAVTGATLTTDRKSQANKAYSFNGTSNHILAGNVGSSIKTISFWMQADDTTSRKIINIDGTDQIELDGSSNVVATSFPGATVYVDGSVGSAILDTNWHLVTITDSTGVSASTFDIGAVSTSYFSGKIDDVRVYNRVLSATEANSLAESWGCSATCATAGTCQTGGGCSKGVCQSVGNVASGQDPNNQCPDTQCNTGTCDGSGACGYYNTLERNCTTACTTCTGATSGSCVNVSDDTKDAEGSNLCNSTCKTCSSGSCTNIPTGTDPDSECGATGAFAVLNSASTNACTTVCGGYSCNSDFCNGSGACGSAQCGCQSIGTDAGGTDWQYRKQLGPGQCSIAASNCGMIMEVKSTSCDGILTDWTYCRCAP